MLRFLGSVVICKRIRQYKGCLQTLRRWMDLVNGMLKGSKFRVCAWGWGGEELDLPEWGFNTHDNGLTSAQTNVYCLKPSGGFRLTHLESQEAGNSMLCILNRCLENPMAGGAWWAAVHGVAKSRTGLHFHFSLSCIGEGNGNPLQCSCLENPRDGGAWWAAVYGVAQSRTRLKWLSSSSSMLTCNL